MAGRIVRTCGSVLLAGGAMLVLAGGALAAPPILGTEDDTIQFDRDDDVLTSNLEVTNPSDAPLTITLVGLDTLASCRFQADPPAVPARRSITVEISSASCELPGNGGTIELRDGTDVIASLTAKPPTEPDALDVGRIMTFFGAAAVGALLVLALVYVRRPAHAAPEPVYDDDGALQQPQPDPDSQAGNKLRLTDELPGLAADWSFSESWATNISAVATIFVALLGSTDVLEAVLGEEPEQAVGRVLVAGALAAFLTGAAPLALKAMGRTVKPSVGGLLVGGALTLTGVAGQILTIGWAVSETDLEEPWRGRALALAVVGAAGLLWYGYRSLRLLLIDAFKPAPSATPDAALYVAAVLLAGSTTPPPTPSQIAGTAATLARATPPAAAGTYPRRLRTSRGDEQARSAVL